MVNKSICIVCLLMLCISVSAQRYIWSPDSIAEDNPNYAMDRYHDLLCYHNPLMYLAYPVIKPVIDRRLALEDGEGKYGYWLEGSFAYRFNIYQGKIL
jgi:hypothetical protein